MYRKFGDIEEGTLFRNIYFSCESFRNHNWNDFYGDLCQEKESYIEGELQRSHDDGTWPEPYFDPIFPITLARESCESFLRSTSLPVTARDYYLSKLFQFLYLALVANFGLEHNETEVRERLERFLDGIPVECTKRLAEFDWTEFYSDTLNYELDDVLRRLPLHLPVPKREISSERMTKARWVDENWPSRLKQARGADPQKVAAKRFGVSTETYKKWEQGVRPPAQKYLGKVSEFTGYSESET